MAPVPTNTKFHFSHPNHPLVHHSDHREYICGGCKTSGSGDRYRCHFCNFDLHKYCADCPEKLSSPIHDHLLTLFLRKPKGARLNELICDVCRDPVDGLFYRCGDCDDFNAHPVCTQLPRELRHAADINHSLKLQKPPFGSCAVCKKDCSSLWVYGCEICRVNIHLDCVFEPYDSPATRWREPPVPPPGLDRSGSGTTSRGIPPPWAAGQPHIPGGSFPWDGGYSGGQFYYGFDAKPYQYPYGNFGMGGHYSGAYGYAVPYSVPNHHFVHPNPGFAHHGSVQYSNGNHQPSQAVNAAVVPSSSSSSSGGKLGKSMFALVGRLTFGVISCAIFGFPIGF